MLDKSEMVWYDEGISAGKRRKIYMITELLQRQITKDLEFIQDNIESFVAHFYSPEEACRIEEDSLKYFPTVEIGVLYIQKHYYDEDGDQRVHEEFIKIEKYNDWAKGVLSGV